MVLIFYFDGPNMAPNNGTNGTNGSCCSTRTKNMLQSLYGPEQS
jgi:hypothetical protein